ncbi:hypothetical protein SETIT_8G019000v2 [Setaria italica]|uniref:Uncharacterized protein n=1 Tax=Setaria italica TaxID=4555 RepID=A0A368S3I6_SETIT|nr:hypothetical protein SETIT_8G019000v2 [Setaria italica]
MGYLLPNACYSTWFPQGSDCWLLPESPRRVSTTAMDISKYVLVILLWCKRQQLSGLQLAAKASSSWNAFRRLTPMIPNIICTDILDHNVIRLRLFSKCKLLQDLGELVPHFFLMSK